MSVHENSKEMLLEKAPQSTHRLYPSLPHADRFEACLPVSSDRRNTSPEVPVDLLLDNPQLEDLLDSDYINMKAQIIFLEEQRRELLQINKKWAKEYTTMVKYYKDKLQHLKAAQPHKPIEGEKVKRVTPDNTDTSQQTDEMKVEVEAGELQRLNSTLTRRGRHQHEEIKRLNKALQEALCNNHSRETEGETLQDVWKHQAEVYKEDFQRERRDREKLQEKYQELEKRFRKTREEMQLLKSQMTQVQWAQVCSCHHRVETPNWDMCPVEQQQHKRLQRSSAVNSEH